jgi:hypothetical protein
MKNIFTLVTFIIGISAGMGWAIKAAQPLPEVDLLIEGQLPAQPATAQTKPDGVDL